MLVNDVQSANVASKVVTFGQFANKSSGILVSFSHTANPYEKSVIFSKLFSVGLAIFLNFVQPSRHTVSKPVSPHWIISRMLSFPYSL